MHVHSYILLTEWINNTSQCRMFVMEQIPLDPNEALNNLGCLPVVKGLELTLAIPDNVPRETKNWLIYAFVTRIGPTNQYVRVHYTFSNTDRGNCRTC